MAESSYEKHRESAERMESARTKADTARSLLIEANENQIKAVQKYQAILEDAKKEVTPELIMEAYDEYKGFLKGEMAAAMEKDDFGEAVKLGEKLKRIAEIYEKDERLAEDVEQVVRDVERVLAEHNIPAADRGHYLNRAKILAEKLAEINPGNVPVAIHKEIHSKPDKKAVPPFTGWEKTETPRRVS